VKLSKIFRIILFLILFFGVTAYIVFAVWKFRDGNPDEVCMKVQIDVKGDPRDTFLDADKVQEMLEAAHVYPKGKLMRNVNTLEIEEALRSNTFIEQVECYKAANNKDIGAGKVCVRVSLRTPVVFVLPDNQAGYYVDASGMVIPNSSYSRNIVTATGKISQEYATNELAQFGAFIRANAFWDNQIEQIYVAIDPKGQRVVTLVPRVGDQEIYMGTLDGYEKKLRRLRIFYQKGIPEFGWNKYKRLNLEFDNQIVCTK